MSIQKSQVGYTAAGQFTFGIAAKLLKPPLPPLQELAEMCPPQKYGFPYFSVSAELHCTATCFLPILPPFAFAAFSAAGHKRRNTSRCNGSMRPTLSKSS